MDPLALRARRFANRTVLRYVDVGRRALLGTPVYPSTLSYQQFVILCAGRTGSNMLVGLLQSHPKVDCYREVFHFSKPSWGLDHLRYLNTPQNIALRESDPAEFLDRLVFGPRPVGHQAVGFKLLYWHMEGDRDPWRSRVLPAVQRDSSLKVIHLVRRDKLATVVSGHQAKMDKVWVKEREARVGLRPPVRLSPTFVERRVRTLERMEVKYDTYFMGHDVLKVYYEDLVSEAEDSVNEIGRFLGLSSHTYRTKTAKTGRDRIEERIENYVELKHHFEGTDLERLFTAGLQE